MAPPRRRSQERLSVDRLADVEALRLLVERVIGVAPDFALTDRNCGAACEICRRLDGLPPAIELAAVRLASMTADDLRERLDDRLRHGQARVLDWRPPHLHSRS